MARALYAYLEPDHMPDRAALQATIRKLGLALTVDEAWVRFSAPPRAARLATAGARVARRRGGAPRR